MADEQKQKQAETVYATLCEALDEMELKYMKFEDDFTILSGGRGEDLPFELVIRLNRDLEVITVLSRMPFAVPEECRDAMSVAVSLANDGLPDGNFDYNYKDGMLAYRLTACYCESLISKKLFNYMVKCSVITIDKYNDVFFKVCSDNMSIEQVLDFVK